MPVCRSIAGIFVLLSLQACGGSEEGVVEEDVAAVIAFDSAEVKLVAGIDTTPLLVEVAETPPQRAFGLMERSALSEDAGMLFTYEEPQPAGAGFYMFRTRIPLDIAFIDTAGTIVSIRSMDPCESPDPRWCPTYGPDSSYVAALEVNRGFFESRGLRVGDRVVLPN